MYGVGTSVAWEFTVEFRESVSINDVILTSAAGTVIGEYLHWLGRYFDSACGGAAADPLGVRIGEQPSLAFAADKPRAATFANPKLLNEMARDEAGNVRQGSLARLEPDGAVMRMWEVIEAYMERRQPLVIIAGADYGQGSSRDWAAKGVRLAGVEAIVAEGFERIHRTNLIGMGVLPLEFKPGTTRKTLGIDGTETFDVIGERKPRADLTLVIHRKNGERVEVPVTCRLDSDEEVSIYEAGGVLQRFAQDFLESSKEAA